MFRHALILDVTATSGPVVSVGDALHRVARIEVVAVPLGSQATNQCIGIASTYVAVLRA